MPRRALDRRAEVHSLAHGQSGHVVVVVEKSANVTMMPECGQWAEWATQHGEDEPTVLRPQLVMTDCGLSRRFARRRAARSGLRPRRVGSSSDGFT